MTDPRLERWLDDLLATPGLTAIERKVVHVRLKEFPGVVTGSEGTEPNRFVVISPE